MLINADRGQCAKGYVAALKALQRYFGTEDIKFHQLTHVSIQGYIESLAHTATAKSKYPCCIKTVFKVACDEFNDYDRNIIKIKTQPFIKIRIPDKEVAEKRALEIATIKKFFSWELPETRMALPLQELGRDVCLMSFCLAGINSVDLYKMQKSCLRDDWTLCYNRSKVMSRRDDKAYMEIKVPSLIRPLLEKYKDKDKNSVKLFNFHKRFASSDSFNADVNCGIKTVCKIAEIKPFSFYAFRHSWATIANNDLDASIEMIAFCLNHQSAHKVAWRYTKKDFTKIDKLNDQVLKYVFG